MEGLIGKLVPIAVSVVMGLVVTHPRTWRVELAKLQYSMLKEAIRTIILSGEIPMPCFILVSSHAGRSRN